MRLEANGLSFSVRVEGSGVPVLLLHGFPDSGRLWRHQVGALTEAGFRVVAPDLRGFGDSDRPEGVDAYFVLNVIEDLRGILDALEIERAHVVGHDWGSAAAWVFAAAYPDRALSLTALSVGHPAAFQGGGMEQLARSWYMLLFQFEGVAEEWLTRNDWENFRRWAHRSADKEEQIANLSRPGRLTAGLNLYRANITPQSWVADPPPLPPITVPTMGIWSDSDFALTEDQMLGSQKYVTGPWRYERIEDVGHWIPLEAPDQLNELLLDFFAREAALD